jgi:hypothetical protein
MVQLLVALTVITFLLAAPPYVINTVKGKTKPERATWFIWSILGLIAFVAQAKLGATWSLVFAGVDALGSIITFGLSIRFGVGGWTQLDRIALVIAALGVIISLVEQQPIIALLGVILADASGTILTIRKTFLAPDSETTISWLLVAVGAVCSILSIGRFDLVLMLFPAYLALANLSVVVSQLIGRRMRQTHKQRASIVM